MSIDDEFPFLFVDDEALAQVSALSGTLMMTVIPNSSPVILIMRSMSVHCNSSVLMRVTL